MKRQLAHAALAVAGLLAVVWVFTWGAAPQISCRGAVMGPGDVCTSADGEREQTYEQRYAAAQDARPVIGVVGTGVAAFGCALIVLERRRSSGAGGLRPTGSSARTGSDPRPTASPQ